jgi:selenocysteine lyase/cysteine desulfurase
MLLADGFDVEPMVRGGTGSRSESEEMPEHLPDRLEAGTPNGVGAVGLGAACAWLREKTVEAVHDHEKALALRLAGGIVDLPGVKLHGWEDTAPHTGLLSFTIENRDDGEVATQLDREHGICVRAGLHCAPAAHRRIGTFPDGTIRAGIGPFNSEEDVDALVEAVRMMTTS